MSHALNEIVQNADRHLASANEIGRELTDFTELACLLEKYQLHDNLGEVQEIFRAELTQHLRLKASHASLQEIVQRMRARQAGEGMADALADLYKDQVNEILIVQERTIEKGEEMLEFKKAVWEAAHPDEPFVLETGDDDLAVVAGKSDDNLICPITRKEFVDPVKNTCGHVYSRDAIFGILNRSRQQVVPCPIVGCNGNVSATSLKLDTTTQRKVAKQKKRKRPEEDNIEDL